MTKEYKFTPVTKDEAGSRLDRILHKQYSYLNQARIEKSLRSKLIMVNGQKAASNYRVNLGDHIQVAVSLIQDDIPRDVKFISPAHIKMVSDNIIYQDAGFIAINKPSGLAVQGGSGIKVSVDDIMPTILKNMETWDSGSTAHKLVHRLDKETSGILLIALNNKSAQELAYGFHEKLIEKTYLAILKGHVKTNNGTISTIINNSNRQIDEDNAVTNYRVLARKANMSLVEFKPITGKTHQLRLHSLELGFPILGDAKYDLTIIDKKSAKLHLHAAEIYIPFQDSVVNIKAELPNYFIDTLNQYGLSFNSRS